MRSIFCLLRWKWVALAVCLLGWVSFSQIPVGAISKFKFDASSSYLPENSQLNLVTVIGWPTGADKDGLVSAGKPLASKVKYFFESVIIHECPTQIFVLTEDAGPSHVQKIWDELPYHGQASLKIVSVNISSVFAWTDKELVPRGVGTSFKYRIWHWPKFWIKRILSEITPSLRFILMVDVDGLVLKPLCRPVRETFKELLQNKKCIAGVREPHVPQQIPIVNTGLLFLDLECLPADWYSKAVTDAIEGAEFKGQQWPPEQWLYSALFEKFPGLFQALPFRWHRHCSEEKLPDNKEALDQAMYMHYCGTTTLTHKEERGPILTAEDLEFTKQFLARLDAKFAANKTLR